MEENNNSLWKYFYSDRKLFYRLSFFAVLVGIIIALFLPKLYKTSFSFFPNSSSAGGMESVRSVAVSIGLGISGMDAEGYDLTNIVNSDRVKRNIVKNKWSSKKFNENIGLVHYWGIPDRTSLNPLDWFMQLVYFIFSIPQEENELLHEKIAINKFSSRYTVTKNNLTGLITIDLWMEEPQLTQDIAELFLEEIKSYVFEIEFANASQQKTFIEERIYQVKKDLTENEEKLKSFREKNRNISVPELLLQEDRLKREVLINTQVYITLQEQLELTKIQEIGQKDPIFSLDTPQFPPKKDRPKRALIVLVSFTFALMFYIVTVVLKNRHELFE